MTKSPLVVASPDPVRGPRAALPVAVSSLGRHVAAALPRDPASVRQRLEAMEHLLERIWVIPIINRPVGLDVVLDLVPGIGPVVAAAMGSWLAWEARNLGLSRWTVARMAGNILVDFLLGLIPWIGAIPDFFFRSNSRNMRIIRRQLDRHHPVDVPGLERRVPVPERHPARS